ncbi:MAG: hypothetical protein KDD35_08720, partial [Bdellovibrionales bacterium]|nr:hypothetical protein [Bdellovibrionales bacterium]
MLWIRPSSFTLYLFSFALFSSAHATLPLSFHQALNEMQSRNLEIQTQQEKVKKMHWALFAQWSNFFPKFSIQT